MNKARAFPDITHTQNIQHHYSKPDIAKAIYDKAKELETNKDHKGNLRPIRIKSRDIGEILYRHYADIGLADDDGPFGLGLDDKGAVELRKLHNAVKRLYLNIVRKSQRGRNLKDGNNQTLARLSTHLPKNHNALMKRLGHVGQNRDLNTAIREGKIIFYANIFKDNHGGDIDAAARHFRTSTGQAEIQRAEAFAKVWRVTKDQAARTAKAWSDKKGDRTLNDNGIESDDILGGKLIQDATSIEGFNEQDFNRHAPLLFGRSARSWLSKDIDFKRKMLRFALKSTKRIRDDLTHFKSRKKFAQRLSEDWRIDDWKIDKRVIAQVKDMFLRDQKDSFARSTQDLKGVELNRFLDKRDMKHLLNAVSRAFPGDIVLPKFNRVLQRTENIRSVLNWPREEQRNQLPSAARAEIFDSNKGARARFVATKLIYENVFGDWLETQPPAIIESWYNQATAEMKLLAKAVNKTSPHMDVIPAKAESIGENDRKSIATIFNALSGLIASEIRDQNAYEANPELARKNSLWIENFKLNLIALAFAEFLDTENFGYLKTIKGTLRKAAKTNAPLIAEHDLITEDWAAFIYFYLHLVPPADISNLFHQFRKMEALEAKGETNNDDAAGAGEAETLTTLRQIFHIRQSMHKEKFQGDEGSNSDTLFAREFFEDPEDFQRVFTGAAPGSPIAGLQTGLRELTRFGHLEKLKPLFEHHKIITTTVDDLLEMEAKSFAAPSLIARKSEKRKALHKNLSTAKSANRDELVSYKECVEIIGRHRRLSSDLRMGTHLSIHHLMMRVFSRLASYCHDWERDRLFVFLGMLSRDKDGYALQILHPDLKPKHLNESNALLKSQNENWIKDKLSPSVYARFAQAFGKNIETIRNQFSHHNSLALQKPDINLTHEINEIRKLTAYDRKRKNSVSKSIKDLLQREGILISWEMNDHQLKLKSLTSAQIIHLKGKNLDGKAITESRHSDLFVKMVEALFS